MPKKRSGSTAVKTSTSAQKTQLNRRVASSLSEEPVRSVSSLKNDVYGVLIAILGIIGLIALLSDSSAPVTHALGYGLRVIFGSGALLVPLALLLISITLFLKDLNAFSYRVAIGLCVIILSCLTCLSLMIPNAERDPSLVYVTASLISAGGYTGSGFAWLLLTFLGKPVGFVVSIGFIVIGLVICGFSISDALTKFHNKARAKRLSRVQKQAVETGFISEDGLEDGKIFTDQQNPKKQPFAFLGTRKTKLLKRKDSQTENQGKLRPLATQTNISFNDIDSQDELLSEQKTTLLKSKKQIKQEESVVNESEQQPTKIIESAKTTVLNKSNNVSSKAIQKEKSFDEKPPVQTTRPGEQVDSIELPPFSLLESNPNSSKSASSSQELTETGTKLQNTLAEFGLKSQVVGYVSGPLVTTFKIEMGEGERVNKITNLQDDIQLSLASESVRIFAPIPGTSLVGIEIPNKSRQSVYLGDVLPFAQGGPLEFAVGRDSEGRPVIANLAKMPHLLIAGTTGSGKSVMINSLIMSILMRATPEQVRLILVDPKRVEFSGYNGLPHLYIPVVTEPRQASSALQWAVTEMERRLKVFERCGARDIRVYNNMCVSGKLSELDNPPTPMPYLVIVIDELSDLMMVAGKEVEASIVRIAQLARAAGIHLIVATQRPSADVVTGLIKSNIDSRIALKVSSSIDSRVILDSVGADRLLGHGDMLFRYSGSQTRRILGCYTSDKEIEDVVSFICDQAQPDYHNEILSAVQPAKQASQEMDELDPLFWEAAEIVVQTQIGSTSGLQRRLSVGYARAGRIMDMLEAKGIVGPPDGSKPREVLVDEKELAELQTIDSEEVE